MVQNWKLEIENRLTIQVYLDFFTLVLLMSLLSGDDDRRRGAISSKQTTNVKKEEVQIENGITFSSKSFLGKSKYKK